MRIKIGSSHHSQAENIGVIDKGMLTIADRRNQENICKNFVNRKCIKQEAPL